MQYIVNSKTQKKEFSLLCEKYNHYMWAVAWAGNIDKFKLAQILEENAYKIEKLIVGLHFYQTAPSFIECFMDKKGVRFVMQSDGTFHPKVYLFYNSKKDWSAIVGSSNFTTSGFGDNCEANILLSSEDGDLTLFEQIKDSISEWWKNAESFDQKKLQVYKQNYKNQFQNLKKTTIFKGNNIVSKLELLNWNEFYFWVQQDHRLQARFELLDRAQKCFKDNALFRNMNERERKGFAGLLKSNYESEPNWAFFGTISEFKYRHHLNDPSSKLLHAIDLIPSSGDVTKKQYDAYTKCFINILGRKNPLASISRLLAIKRPDLFVCINKYNKKKIAESFNISKSDFTVENYWNILESFIWNSEWYIEPKGNKKESELKCWKYRVALLDSISYKWIKEY